MNCPRCGKSIGGYVRAGTIENSRVAKGRCPHCGASMPSGYKVGYASSFAPSPSKQYTSDVCAYMAKKGKSQFYVILLDGFLLALTLSLIGRVKLGCILGGILCLLFGGFVLIRPIFHSSDPVSTDSFPPGNVTIWISWGLALYFSFSFCFKAEAVPKGWPFILLGFALAALLTVKSYIIPYGTAEASVEQEKALLEQKKAEPILTKRIFELYEEEKLTCGKCGRKIQNYSHFSYFMKDNGAVVLCSNCLPCEKSGDIQIGDQTIHQF